MTNEEAKQQAIIKAFGDKWEMFTNEYQKHLLTRKHWVDMSIPYGALRQPNYYRNPTQTAMGVDPMKCDAKHEFWRPIELKGLETNNGWTRIEPDGSNLPKTNSEVWYEVFPYPWPNEEGGSRYTAEGLEMYWVPMKITHFKEYKEPIY